MGITDLSILFNKSNPVYAPGDAVVGAVSFIVDKPKTIKTIKIKFKGKADVEWSETESDTDSEERSTSKTVTYSSKEEYLDHEIILDQRDEQSFTLSLGKYSYPFSVTLPRNIPSSFKHAIGKIVYFAHAEIVVPFSLEFNKTKKQFFIVPTAVEKSKTFNKLVLIPAGKLNICARIPRSAFVPGESVPISLEINNQSDVKMKNINVHLLKHLEFKVTRKTNTSKTKLKSFTFKDDLILPRCTKSWFQSITIPYEDFSYLENCHIITMKYMLQIEAKASGMHCDLDLFIPITIGDIPYQGEQNFEVLHQYLTPEKS